MSIKVVKIVPNGFVHASRDLRELSTLRSLGCEVHVVAKEIGVTYPQYEFEVIRMTSRPLSKYTNVPSVNRLISLLQWSKRVRELKPTIISCHDKYCLLIGWLSTLFLAKKPKLVYDSHEFEYARNEKRGILKKCFVKYQERFLIKKCAFSIMVNDSIADAVMKLHGLKQRPIVVRNIPNYWILDKESILSNKRVLMKEYNIDESETILLYQGGVTTGRGIENAIKALKFLDKTRLIILGNGGIKYIESLKCLSNEEGVAHRTIFMSAVPSEQLCHYTGIADIGLCNIDNVCLSYYYSLPNKLFEYIQALVPIIGSDFPEIKKIIENYKVGICCNSDDPNSIANAVDVIRQMKKSEDLMICLNKAKEELCWEKEEVTLKNAYAKLIADMQLS